MLSLGLGTSLEGTPGQLAGWVGWQDGLAGWADRMGCHNTLSCAALRNRHDYRHSAQPSAAQTLPWTVPQLCLLGAGLAPLGTGHAMVRGLVGTPGGGGAAATKPTYPHPATSQPLRFPHKYKAACTPTCMPSLVLSARGKRKGLGLGLGLGLG